MTATIDMLSIRDLTQVVNKIPTPEPIVLNTVFGNAQQKAAETIDIEIVESGQGLAQFTPSGGSAKLINKHSRTRKTITLPTTYEQYIFTDREMLDYQALGQLYSFSAVERQAKANEWILMHVVELKNRIMRRREQLACAALTTAGNITITQDDLEFTIDYGLVADTHIITLTGNDVWDNTASKPVDQIMDAANTTSAKCGYTVDTCLLGISAAKPLLSNAKILAQLNASNNAVGRLDLRNKQTIGGKWLGNLYGVDIWLVAQKYKTSAGVLTDMFPAKFASFIPSEGKNAGLFSLPTGPIGRYTDAGDFKLNFVEFLLEAVVDKDHKNLEWKIEQKSLPVISDPDAVYTVQVIA